MDREQFDNRTASEENGWLSLAPQKELDYYEVDSAISESAEDCESDIVSRNRRIGEKVLRISNISETAHHSKITAENLPDEREDTRSKIKNFSKR